MGTNLSSSMIPNDNPQNGKREIEYENKEKDRDRDR